jgi:hypothetical protein
MNGNCLRLFAVNCQKAPVPPFLFLVCVDRILIEIHLKSTLNLPVKYPALSPLGQEAIVFAPRLPEDRGNPIPRTSDTAAVCPDEG